MQGDNAVAAAANNMNELIQIRQSCHAVAHHGAFSGDAGKVSRRGVRTAIEKKRGIGWEKGKEIFAGDYKLI